jgi:hypothetical protein
LTANAQAWPRNLNSPIGGNSNFVYLIVADIGTPTGHGLDFINGFAFLCVEVFSFQEDGVPAAISAIYTYLDRAGKDRTTLKD